jgi:aspartyl-tRNA(Asn)/glutamyl-tRNA(Gln) amidotransferase subunit A
VADEDGLPTGFQVLAPIMADDRLYRTGAALEAALLERWGGPLMPPELGGGDQAPTLQKEAVR